MIRSEINKVLPNKDYPYMNARVAAKGAKLLDKKDYNRLLKMDENEAARKLEENGYGKEINEIGSGLEGTDLILKAVRKNLYREMNNLIKISPEDLKPVIRSYIQRINVINYKRIVKWKKSDKKQNLSEIITPTDKVDEDFINEIPDRTLNDILDEINLGEEEPQEKLKAEDSLKELEKKLDRKYYRELLNQAEKVRDTKYKQFVENEIEYENLKTILRLKHAEASEKEIQKKMIDLHSSSLLEDCIKSSGIEEMVELLSESKWNIEKDTMTNMELQLETERTIQARKTMKTDSLGLRSVLAYILSKITEVENLRMIAQAKKTSLPQKEVEKNLVIE